MSFNVFKILELEKETTFKRLGKVNAGDLSKAIAKAKNKFHLKELTLSQSNHIKTIPLYPKWVPLSLKSNLTYFQGNGTEELLAGRI